MMAWAALIAAALTAGVLGALLRPLLRPTPLPAPSAEAVNIAIARARLAELHADRAAGQLDPARYAEARADLERELAGDLGQDVPLPAPPPGTRAVALVLAIVLPLAALLLYAWLGEPRGIGATPSAATASAMPDIPAMVERLAARLKQQPNDLAGWQMLGRSYRMLERYPEAADAYGHAYGLSRQSAPPLAAQIAVDYAEALALVAEGSLAGKPSELLAEALQHDPRHPKALWMSGFAAMQRQDWAAAVRHWETLSAQDDLDPATAQTLSEYLAKARSQLSPGQP